MENARILMRFLFQKGNMIYLIYILIKMYIHISKGDVFLNLYLIFNDIFIYIYFFPLQV